MGGGFNLIQTFPKFDFPTRWGGGGGVRHIWDMSPNYADFFFEVTPNRLIPTLDKIVGKTQMAYIPGTYIAGVDGV